MSWAIVTLVCPVLLAETFNHIKNFQAVIDFPKNDVLSIQVLLLFEQEEELRAVGVWTSVSH